MCEKSFHSVQPQWARTACTAAGLSSVLGDVFWKTFGSTVESPEETTKTDQESRKEVNKPSGVISAYVAEGRGRNQP